MFKKFLVLALAAFCGIQAVTVETQTADADLLQKQKQISELFLFINQDKLIGSEWYEVGQNYDIESNIDLYNDKNVVQEFLYRFRLGLLPRNSLFTVFRREQREELRILVRLLYTAKDFITFYKTAAWCRIYLNKGLLITALTTAVLYRNDCKYIVLPPLYETYPNLFLDNQIIQQAYRLKSASGTKISPGLNNVDTYLIDSNLTGVIDYYSGNEGQLSYFTNDVDLNNYYFYLRNIFPLWITLKDLDLPQQLRGEAYYWIHQQLLARYNLERLSVGLGEIEDLDVNKPIVPGCCSNLVYANGVAVPCRYPWSYVPIYKYEYVKEIEVIEKRILDAIDLGYVIDKTGKRIDLYTTEGINILGNLIEGNYDSCNIRLYGALEILYRNLLGLNYDCKNKNCVIPSLLETLSGGLRDPVFYRLWKIIIGLFIRYKSNLPTYTRSDLLFNGVTIENVNVDRLITYTGTCEYIINNALTVSSLQDGLKQIIKAKKPCLKYKPFTWNIIVKSDRNVKGIVRIYLGPSVDENIIDQYSYISKNWYNFVELDKFTTDLTVGLNTIKRYSTDCANCNEKTIGGAVLYKKILQCIKGSETCTLTNKIVGYPSRLYLPRGRVGGLPLKLFVVITPINESNLTIVNLPAVGQQLLDGRPLGFPLDRPVLPWILNLKNILYKDVYINYEKDIDNIYTPTSYNVKDTWTYDSLKSDKWVL